MGNQRPNIMTPTKKRRRLLSAARCVSAVSSSEVQDVADQEALKPDFVVEEGAVRDARSSRTDRPVRKLLPFCG
jgi:hypothetical protein